MIQNKSCNGCYYEHNRTCYWFEIVNGSSPKIIPNDTFNKGCKQYKNNNIVKSKVIDKFIKVFNGEIIGDKYTPKKWFGNYKKKTYTTRHKYTERKDF
tara:strand:- start:837 stop:1130 length:294 start_codon:yes stop_codon:yes gene_type:complete